MRLPQRRSYWIVLGQAVLIAATAGGQEAKSSPRVPSATAPPAAGAVATQSIMEDSCVGITSPCCELLPEADCCCPLWTYRAGAVFLKRDNQGDFVLTDGLTPLTIGGLSFSNYEAGPMLTVMRHNILDTAATLELTYFGVWNENTSAATDVVIVGTTPPIFIVGGGTVDANYRSRLDSVELNLRRTWGDWFTLLAGVRAVELMDELSSELMAGGGQTATHRVNVNNHLLGAQIGADVLVYHTGRLSVEWIGKAGLYGNSADQDTTIAGVGGALPSVRARDDVAAFVGELGLTGVFDVNDRWSLRGGYQALWLDRIALAPNQLANSNLLTGIGRLDATEEPIYHGFTFTAQAAW